MKLEFRFMCIYCIYLLKIWVQSRRWSAGVHLSCALLWFLPPVCHWGPQLAVGHCKGCKRALCSVKSEEVCGWNEKNIYSIRGFISNTENTWTLAEQQNETDELSFMPFLYHHVALARVFFFSTELLQINDELSFSSHSRCLSFFF